MSQAKAKKHTKNDNLLDDIPANKTKLGLVFARLIKLFSNRSWTHNPTVVGVIAVSLTLLVVFIVAKLNHHTQSSQSQLSQVETEVGRLMFLPTTETPALAVVTDQSKLQSSLKSVAQTGDDILIYDKHAQAIVYRPSVNKIVAVIPVFIGQQPNAALTVAIAILNGSGSSTKMQQFITNLYRLFPNLNLVYKDNAPRSFPTTIVFSQTGSGSSLEAQVAQSLNIQAGQDPLGIPSDLATLTFIVGQDYQ